MSIQTNASEVAAAIAARGPAFGNAVAIGIRAVTQAVHSAAVANLTGSGAAYSYPVPVRKGQLRRSMGTQSERTEGFVFNTAAYANAVHTGNVHQWNGMVKQSARPFLDDAVETVDVLGLMAAEIKKVLQ